MTNSDLQALKNFLERSGGFSDSYNRDLLDDAINAGAGTSRCELALKTLASNLRNAGRRDLAEHVEYYL